jgi:NADPH-dependent 2,4-dienoyl-CoA reductase/sulfur reductase-like enzyme
VGGDATFAGSLGTQAVKVFDLVAAGTGLRDDSARAGGYHPITVATTADDHKAYYPGATPLRLRITGDRVTGRLLGAQILGSRTAEVAKRIDIFATAISYGAAVADAVQIAATNWTGSAQSNA